MLEQCSFKQLAQQTIILFIYARVLSKNIQIKKPSITLIKFVPSPTYLWAQQQTEHQWVAHCPSPQQDAAEWDPYHHRRQAWHLSPTTSTPGWRGYVLMTGAMESNRSSLSTGNPKVPLNAHAVIQVLPLIMYITLRWNQMHTNINFDVGDIK